FIDDALVSQELGPCADRRVGEVVGRAFPVAMPASRRLRRRLPEKRETGIAVAEAETHPLASFRQREPGPRCGAPRARAPAWPPRRRRANPRPVPHAGLHRRVAPAVVRTSAGYRTRCTRRRGPPPPSRASAAVRQRPAEWHA